MIIRVLIIITINELFFFLLNKHVSVKYFYKYNIEHKHKLIFFIDVWH